MGYGEIWETIPKTKSDSHAILKAKCQQPSKSKIKPWARQWHGHVRDLFDWTALRNKRWWVIVLIISDFVPRINHVINFRILDGSLSVMVDKLQLIDCQFNDVDSMNGQGKYTVGQNGAKTAFKFMESMLYNFRIYPIGDRFKLNSNANTVQVETAGNGLWIIWFNLFRFYPIKFMLLCHRLSSIVWNWFYQQVS